ncbi:hypothetical protein [Nocardia fluminea]|uniref:hypothetical protein n=1 Tax=Nocardia fluminea TaxID=134984 RepID=UPI0033CAD01C
MQRLRAYSLQILQRIGGGVTRCPRSHRDISPRAQWYLAPESLDGGDFESVGGMLDSTAIADALGDSIEIESLHHRHQGFDEEFSVNGPGAVERMMVAELSASRIGDRRGHNAFATWGVAQHPGDYVEPSTHSRDSGCQREHPMVGTGFGESSHVLQEVGMADTVEGVDTEPDADSELDRYVERCGSQQTRDIFHGRSEARLVTGHQQIGSARGQRKRSANH